MMPGGPVMRLCGVSMVGIIWSLIPFDLLSSSTHFSLFFLEHNASTKVLSAASNSPLLIGGVSQKHWSESEL
jgi:hypothetical protein